MVKRGKWSESGDQGLLLQPRLVHMGTCRWAQASGWAEASYKCTGYLPSPTPSHDSFMQVHIGKLRHRKLQWSTQGNTFTVGRDRLQSGAGPLLPAWMWIPRQQPLTYPELRHLDDEAHGHVDDGTLPVVHRDKVGGQLIEPRMKPLGEAEETH